LGTDKKEPETGLGLGLTLLVGGEGQVLEDVGLGEALGVVGGLLQHPGHGLVHPEDRVVVVVVHIRLSPQPKVCHSFLESFSG